MTDPTTDDSKAALAAVLRVTMHSRADEEDAAAILAAMPGWTLVRDLDWAAGVTAAGREKECEAEIARLRAALKRVVGSAYYERDVFGARLPDGLLLDIEIARAALASQGAG